MIGGARSTLPLVLCATLVACGSDPTASAIPREPLALEPGQIGTFIGTGEKATDPIDGDADGRVDPPVPGLGAHLDSPLDVTISPEGRFFVIDWNGHKIRELLSDGKLAFVAGTGVEGDACEAALVDGKCPATAAEMNHPTDVTFDSDGRMVIAAWHNAKIKRLDLGTNLVENVCGTGGRKYAGDGLTCVDASGKPQVAFDLPSSVAYDGAGNLFVADQANQVIRRISAADGTLRTVAGNCPGTPGFGCPLGSGYTGDGGPATVAHLTNDLGQGTDPQGKIAFDRDGNLLIADTGNNVIRRVTPGADGIIGDGDPSEEIISTIVGTGERGFDGDGGPATSAQLSSPVDVAVAKDGTFFIADRGNSCVRRVSPDGIITTAAGTCGTPGFEGDGVLATEAGLRNPYGVALDDHGYLYVSDTRNDCIRRVRLE
ncbi:MAG TPA: hypothetical protein VHE30_15645 [Polyangiaceae bacterium]|nr:hypothetical protein [Polyangiaceae bacterium]